jgi:hypothetical protein
MMVMGDVTTIKSVQLDSLTQYWTLREFVQHQNQFIGRGGAEYFAVITLNFAPTPDTNEVIFIHAAPPDTTYIATYDEEPDPTDIANYVAGIEEGITAELAALSEAGQPIRQLTITLTELRIHPVDSKKRAYRMAAQKAIRTVLASPRLVPISRLSSDKS